MISKINYLLLFVSSLLSNALAVNSPKTSLEETPAEDEQLPKFEHSINSAFRQFQRVANENEQIEGDINNARGGTDQQNRMATGTDQQNRMGDGATPKRPKKNGKSQIDGSSSLVADGFNLNIMPDKEEAADMEHQQLLTPGKKRRLSKKKKNKMIEAVEEDKQQKQQDADSDAKLLQKPADDQSVNSAQLADNLAKAEMATISQPQKQLESQIKEHQMDQIDQQLGQKMQLQSLNSYEAIQQQYHQQLQQQQLLQQQQSAHESVLPALHSNPQQPNSATTSTAQPLWRPVAVHLKMKPTAEQPYVETYQQAQQQQQQQQFEHQQKPQDTLVHGQPTPPSMEQHSVGQWQQVAAEHGNVQPPNAAMLKWRQIVEHLQQQQQQQQKVPPYQPLAYRLPTPAPMEQHSGQSQQRQPADDESVMQSSPQPNRQQPNVAPSTELMLMWRQIVEQTEQLQHMVPPLQPLALGQKSPPEEQQRPPVAQHGKMPTLLTLLPVAAAAAAAAGGGAESLLHDQGEKLWGRRHGKEEVVLQQPQQRQQKTVESEQQEPQTKLQLALGQFDMPQQKVPAQPQQLLRQNTMMQQFVVDLERQQSVHPGSLATTIALRTNNEQPQQQQQFATPFGFHEASNSATTNASLSLAEVKKRFSVTLTANAFNEASSSSSTNLNSTEILPKLSPEMAQQLVIRTLANGMAVLGLHSTNYGLLLTSATIMPPAILSQSSADAFLTDFMSRINSDNTMKHLVVIEHLKNKTTNVHINRILDEIMAENADFVRHLAPENTNGERNAKMLKRANLLMTYFVLNHKLLLFLNATAFGQNNILPKDATKLHNWMVKVIKGFLKIIKNESKSIIYVELEAWLASRFWMNNVYMSAKVAILIAFPPYIQKEWVDNGTSWSVLKRILLTPSNLDAIMAFHDERPWFDTHSSEEIIKIAGDRFSCASTTVASFMDQICETIIRHQFSIDKRPTINLVLFLGLFRRLIAELDKPRYGAILTERDTEERQNALKMLQLCTMLFDAKFDSFKDILIARISTLDQIRKGQIGDRRE